MSRTGLSPADIAESFRDRCGDGSVEWVYTPTQTWVLLDAADMLDENAKLREQIHWLKKGDILHVLTDQEYIDQCERERLMQVSIDALDKENAKLREQLESIVGRSFRTADKMACLEDENAKLRELVRDMNKWLWNGADCTECPFAAKCDLNAAFESDIHAHICLGWSEIHDRMRELGVEP